MAAIRRGHVEITMDPQIELSVAGAFDFSSEAYRELFQRAGATAFQRPEWLVAFYRHLVDRQCSEPRVVVARSVGSGRLLLVLPLVLVYSDDTSHVEFAYADVTDYACPVIHPDLLRHEQRLTVVRESLRRVLQPLGRLYIGSVREVDRSAWEVLLGFAPRELDYGSHQVRPSTPFPDWRKRNFGPTRSAQLARKSRRLRSRGEVALEIVPPAEAARSMEWARRARAGRFVDDPIQRGSTLDFYREIASADTAAFTRTYRLSSGEDTVAVCFGLIDGPCFRFLVLACDYENYAAYSPGMLVLDGAMEHWIMEGGEVFDFTIGDEAYKGDFRCQRTPMYAFDSGYAPPP